MERYPANTEINQESFEHTQLQEALEKMPRRTYSNMWHELSKYAAELVDKGEAETGRIYWLLADTCSMRLKPDSANEPFVPNTVSIRRRSFMPEDLREEEATFLGTVYADIKDPMLRARTADLLWLVGKPRDVDFAIQAINAYMDVPVTKSSWKHDGMDCWDRAFQLSRMIGQASAGKDEEIENKLTTALLSATKEDCSLAFKISVLFNKHRLGKKTGKKIAAHLEKLATEFSESNNNTLAIDYFESAADWYKRSEEEDNSVEMIIACAELYEKEARERQSSSTPSNLVAAYHYETAIKKYRSIPKQFRGKHDVDNRITKLRKQINEANDKALDEMDTVSSKTIDLTEVINNIVKAVSGKDKEYALEALAHLYGGVRVDRLRETQKEILENHPFQTLFDRTHIASDGRVVAKRPGVSGHEKDIEASLWEAMIRQYELEIGLIVNGWIVPALDVIRAEHRIREWEFVSLAAQSPIIPQNREHLIGKGLFAGFDRDFVTSMHLLIPQLEHIVRVHLKQVGEITTFMSKDGIETENGLSALIENRKSREIFGENLEFEIKALFCDSFGPNLRNELAHGLVDTGKACSYLSIYVWWLMYRLTTVPVFAQRKASK